MPACPSARSFTAGPLHGGTAPRAVDCDGAIALASLEAAREMKIDRG
jgi:hypothetical protein